jgi:hypothetical protein
MATEEAMETATITAWTLQNEIPIPDDVQPLLTEGEQAVAAFKTFRDSAVFTTHRLIVRDAQGLTGKKVEIYSLPYSAINMWSSENAGKLDWNSEMELWTRGRPHQDQTQQGRRRPAVRQPHRVGGLAALNDFN